MTTQNKKTTRLDYEQQIAAAERRGARILALNAGQTIPFESTAAADHGSGDRLDLDVLAAVARQRDTREMGARLPFAKKLMTPARNAFGEIQAANEMFCEAIGPHVLGVCSNGGYWPTE